MKKMIIGLVMTSMSTVAFAQSAATTATSASSIAPGAVQTSTATLPEQKPGAEKNWSVSLASENSMGQKDFDDNTLGDTAITSDNSIGAGYKLNKRFKLSAIQYFFVGSNVNKMDTVPGLSEAQYRSNMESGDLALATSYSSDLTVWGSKPLAFTFRYDLPMWRVTKELRRNGSARVGETTLSYVFNPRWSMDVYVCPRFTFNSDSNPNKAVGGDTIARLVAGPAVNYNFNDKVAAYIASTYDGRSTEILRGKSGISGQTLKHELGANFTVAEWTINPAVASENSLNNGSSALLANDSEVFTRGTTTYNLNLYASF